MEKQELFSKIVNIIGLIMIVCVITITTVNIFVLIQVQAGIEQIAQGADINAFVLFILLMNF
jgi:hypothetical protein